MQNVKKWFRKLGIKKSILFLGLFLSEVALLIAAYITRGEMLQNLLFADPKDTFMDFYKVIICGKIPYTLQMIYPPLIHVILSFFGHFIPYDIMDAGAFAVRDSQLGMVIFFLWMLVQLYLFAQLFRKMYDKTCIGKSFRWEREAALLLTLFSLPFLFCFERSNAIFLSLICLIPYIIWYQEEDARLRWAAFVCLAISAAIKIYPAIFGLLLVREKKWKQTIQLIVVGVIGFFGPFLLLEGENRNPLKLLGNLMYTTNAFSKIGCGYRHDLSNMFRIFGILFDTDLTVLGNCVIAIVAVIGIILFFARPDMERWKAYALLSLMMILVTGLNYTYSLIFMVIPMVYFLNDPSRDGKAMQAVYAILFLLMFMPMLLTSHEDLLQNSHAAGWPLTYPAIVESVALIVMLLLIYVQEIKRPRKKRKVQYVAHTEQGTQQVKRKIRYQHRTSNKQTMQ